MPLDPVGAVGPKPHSSRFVAGTAKQEKSPGAYYGGLGPPAPGAINDDILGALRAWRENGLAPRKIIATKYVNDNAADGIAFQRPLCPYPENATYTKTRHASTLATSWACKPGELVTNQKFNRHYGPQ